MRTLKLQVQISIDGNIAGPKGEMDWMMWNWDDELKQFVTDFTKPVDCIILGRKLAEGFIPYWENVAANPNDPQSVIGKKMTETPKVVFTKTLEKSAWSNTVLAKGNLATEINSLKIQDGGDIVVYGGAGFVAGLIREKLIDELNLFVNPVAVGEGMKIFDGKTELQLVGSKPFSCGIVINTYRPVR